MKVFVVLLTKSLTLLSCAKNGPYDTSANARNDIEQALSMAKSQQQPLLIVFGANWCSECQALAMSLSTGKDAEKISTEFQVVKVNIGNFDTNIDIANDYGNPIRGGIPGATILSAKGEIVYVTNPGELSKIRYNKTESLYQFFKKHLL